MSVSNKRSTSAIVAKLLENSPVQLSMQLSTPPASYPCGAFIDVPKRIIESGVAKIVGVEDSTTNKFLCRLSEVWHYLIVECQPSKSNPKLYEPVPFAKWSGVYESELDAWAHELPG